MHFDLFRVLFNSIQTKLCLCLLVLMTHAIENDLSHPVVAADQTAQNVPDAAATVNGLNGLFANQLTENDDQFQNDNPQAAETEKTEEKVVTLVKKVN